MIKVTICALAALALLAGPAASAPPKGGDDGSQPAPSANQPAPSADDAHSPNKVICKHEDVIGSRLGGERVCHTRAEWDEIAHQSQTMTDQAERAGLQMSGGH